MTPAKDVFMLSIDERFDYRVSDYILSTPIRFLSLLIRMCVIYLYLLLFVR